MNDLLNILTMNEKEQRAEIAKYLSPKPFKHEWRYSNAVGGIKQYSNRRSMGL